MSSFELDALIVQNIKDLEEAARHVRVLEERIFRAFEDIASQWAEENGREGEFDGWSPGAWLWLTPAEWRRSGPDEDFIASFYWGMAEIHLIWINLNLANCVVLRTTLTVLSSNSIF